MTDIAAKCIYVIVAGTCLVFEQTGSAIAILLIGILCCPPTGRERP